MFHEEAEVKLLQYIEQGQNEIKISFMKEGKTDRLAKLTYPRYKCCTREPETEVQDAKKLSANFVEKARKAK